MEARVDPTGAVATPRPPRKSSAGDRGDDRQRREPDHRATSRWARRPREERGLAGNAGLAASARRERRERFRDVRRARVTVLGLLGQTPCHNGGEPRVRAWCAQVEWNRSFTCDRGADLAERGALKGPRVREHLVEHDPEREYVGARVDREPERLFGRHVRARSEHRTLARDLRLGVRAFELAVAVGSPTALGEAEVEQLDRARARDHDVLGLEITVHDPFRMRRGEPLCHLGGQRACRRRRQRSRLELVPQRRAFDELHRDVDASVGFSDLVDHGDVGVDERSGRARLAQKSLATLGVARVHLGQELDGHLATKLLVVGTVHDAHASRAEAAEDAKVGDALGVHFSDPLDGRGRRSCDGAEERIGVAPGARVPLVVRHRGRYSHGSSRSSRQDRYPWLQGAVAVVGDCDRNLRLPPSILRTCPTP